MDEGSQADIEEMAKLLKIRKNSHHPTVLLLGARAGRLFRSEQFYEDLQFFSNVNFHGLPRIKQFAECYTILTSDKFSEWDLYSILQTALKDVGVINPDICLASLIKQEYFDEIISTNIDDVLEGALDQTEMRQGRDYEVMRIDSNTPRFEKSHPCRIIKPFGDLVSRYYTVKGRASRLENEKSRPFLQNLLTKNLLIVGIDPTWDRDILRIIPVEASGTIWLVSEQEDIIKESSFLTDSLSARRNNTILGHEGSYTSFIPKLYSHLHGSTFLNYQHHITERVDLLPGIDEKITNFMKGFDSMTEQIARLTTSLSVINEKLQIQQNESDTHFHEISHEIQHIRKQLDEFRRDREV